MTTGVLNYPRRPLTERERGIRETIDRIGDTHPPYIFVSVADAGTLQGVINSLVNGGTIWLEEGTYAAGDLTISNPNVTLQGVSLNSTYLTGNITVTVGQVKIQNLTVRATGKAYGIKLHGSGEVARCELRNVWVGASALAAGDGPVVGLWFDGAIVTVVDHCTFAFNTGAGFYANTTVGALSTNVNTFTDCTFNGNSTYGIHLEIGGDAVAGYMLHRFEGGNIESNITGDVYCDGATFVILRGIDFECSVSHNPGQMIFMNGCQPVVIEDCNFVLGAGVTVQRFFELDGCANAIVRRNRLSVGGGATFSQGAVGIFNEGCVQCTAYDNLLWPAGAGLFINNRGSMRGNVA